MWPWLRAGIEKIVQKTDADFLPEDVWTEVMSGNAVVRVHQDANGDDTGFSVLQKLNSKTGPVLFVWCMAGDLMGEKEAVLADIEGMARQIGAKRIHAKSPRKGWARLGFRVKEIVYEREVPNG
jgi:hypothetical protein